MVMGLKNLWMSTIAFQGDKSFSVFGTGYFGRFLDQIYNHIFGGSHFAERRPHLQPSTSWKPHTCPLFWIGDLTFLKSSLDSTLALENA
jgi:hypothetical protein